MTTPVEQGLPSSTSTSTPSDFPPKKLARQLDFNPFLGLPTVRPIDDTHRQRQQPPPPPPPLPASSSLPPQRQLQMNQIQQGTQMVPTTSAAISRSSISV